MQRPTSRAKSLALIAAMLAAPLFFGVKRTGTRSFDEVLKQYYFVADFSLKPEDREVSDELFWKYPLKLPKVEFPIDDDLDDIAKEMPKTEGSGLAIQHLNRGRKLFLEGNYEAAKATWLTARARYGKTWSHHRRNDYFLALAFMQIAKQQREAAGGNFNDKKVMGSYDNAATFFSWAYNLKEELQDEVVDGNSPKSFYNMAAIYWRYQRFAGAYGAAERGLNHLRKTGGTDFRPQFHRVVAEAHIKNRTYLEAVQQLDIAIRQDRDPKQAAAMFARVGDIYFDLNNYELSADAYEYGAEVDEELEQVNPSQMIMRGEALFWLGKFSESQKMLHFGLEGVNYRNAIAQVPDELASYAALRFADGYLARKEYEKAKLEYYKVAHRFRGTMAARLAQVREACLELPDFPKDYDGKNIRHARELLEKSKADSLPPIARELAWACTVASYAERERNPEMVEKVRLFAAANPESRFLKQFVEPVREVQASKINDYFNAGDTYNAIAFFEVNRANLFKQVDDALAKRLFIAYADTFQPEKAKEFWPVERDTTDLGWLRMAVVAAELADTKDGRAWRKRSSEIAKELDSRVWKVSPDDVIVRNIHRLLATNSAVDHYQWLGNLAKHWAATDSRFVCDLQYPLLSKRVAKGDDIARLDSENKGLIEKHLPDMLKTDQACALSLLDLEAKILDGNLEEVGKRYLSRKSWPLRGTYLHMFWAISEKLVKRGFDKTARDMWAYIMEFGPADSTEARFAAARLDRSKTEFESLWEN